MPACAQVQTIKTAVESAQMLLRIDDIVSGISKKQQVRGEPVVMRHARQGGE